MASFGGGSAADFLYHADKKAHNPVNGNGKFCRNSTGCAVAREEGCDDIILLHCISGYPTPLEQSNLRLINTLREKFNVEIGLSDRTLGCTASVAATALGAALIEKHFTLSRADGG